MSCLSVPGNVPELQLSVLQHSTAATALVVPKLAEYVPLLEGHSEEGTHALKFCVD